jgi:hypothetical protein
VVLQALGGAVLVRARLTHVRPEAAGVHRVEVTVLAEQRLLIWRWDKNRKETMRLTTSIDLGHRPL